MEKLDKLISSMLDGTISADQADELNGLLLEDEAARRRYIEMTWLEDELGVRHVENAMSVPDMIPVPIEDVHRYMDNSPSKIIGNLLWPALGMAALFVIGIFILSRSAGTEQSQPLPMSGFIATLADSNGSSALLRKDGGLIRLGDDLGRSVYELRDGTVNLLFGSGANVKLEAPARFETVDEFNVVLHKGRALATVPEVAIGFTIHTPDVEILDLGTQFGVSVEEGVASDIYVLKGQVALLGKGIRHLLNSQEGMRVIKGKLMEVAKDPSIYDKLEMEYTADYALKGVVDGPYGNIRTAKLEQNTIMKQNKSPFVSDVRGYLVEEAIDHELSNPLSVEHDGTPMLLSGNASPVAGEIPEGTLVNSYLLHADMMSDGGGLRSIMTVSFEKPIIGLQGDKASRTHGNLAFARTNNYGGGKFDMTLGHDRVYIWPDQKTITIHSNIGPRGIDTLRIITGELDDSSLSTKTPR